MEWLTAENLIAVGTALLGVLVSVAAVWYERRVPHQRRIGYRVQLDTSIGDGASGRALTGSGTTVRRGFFDASPDLVDATLVLLRIENDGALALTADHYTDGGTNGLTVEFTGRRVKAVVVTAPEHPRLLSHFPVTWTGPAEGDTSVHLPKVPLNRGSHYKLLVLLTGGPIGSPVNVEGNIDEGYVHVNHSTTPDDKPPVFSRVARTVTVVLTVCVVALAAIIVREQEPPPIGCARGTLTVTGSTAFRPVVRELATKYEHDCPGSTIQVSAHGSTAGIRELAEAGARATAGSPAVVALSDGRKPDGYPQLRESMVAVSLFTLVLNDDIPVDTLTLDQIRRLYRGDITNWKELIPSLDQKVLLVSRDANSGTREVFQRRVLGRNEPANSSRDCVHSDDTESPVIRCELDSTEQVLSTVARLPGALGYTELRSGSGFKGLHRVAIDGRRASLDEIGASPYPYREIEYAYTWGQPPADSLTSSFLTYLSRGSGQDVIRTHGHLPCATPKGLRICGEG
ncbi:MULTISPECIES: PstS family phosphate ABC transporter substrate-binding protein [unclassified Streptomyces]|uniref:PstS family phosphate ABC transporter substrate-binding protein n=1 Tax=unclassified Streptomyces TaxID=2593676 RepID=UPI00166026C5|nr:MULTISPECIES: substrate-binding domain-containing protein [unclassified Streptomyces]MBD0712056.1 phosphate ABC transporter substrate-binding protein [Streptomyces sp. CBMA291]MBD0717959.1 phosphate ABC transporter substrate-binding protein [Streptomyces sp. CBMA370]